MLTGVIPATEKGAATARGLTLAGHRPVSRVNEAFRTRGCWPGAADNRRGIWPRPNVNGGAIAIGHPPRRQRRPHHDHPGQRPSNRAAGRYGLQTMCEGRAAHGQTPPFIERLMTHMSSHSTSKIFVVGRHRGPKASRSSVPWSPTRKYSVRFLSPRLPPPGEPRALLALDNVLRAGGLVSPTKTSLREGLRGCDGAFINIDGFQHRREDRDLLGECAVTKSPSRKGSSSSSTATWTMASRNQGMTPDFAPAHYDGKRPRGRVDLVSEIRRMVTRMGAALFTSGPYIEMVISPGDAHDTDHRGMVVLTWRVPLGGGEAVPHVSLEDCGY